MKSIFSMKIAIFLILSSGACFGAAWSADEVLSGFRYLTAGEAASTMVGENGNIYKCPFKCSDTKTVPCVTGKKAFGYCKLFTYLGDDGCPENAKADSGDYHCYVCEKNAKYKICVKNKTIDDACLEWATGPFQSPDCGKVNITGCEWENKECRCSAPRKRFTKEPCPETDCKDTKFRAKK